jgi:hypothetical protein
MVPSTCGLAAAAAYLAGTHDLGREQQGKADLNECCHLSAAVARPGDCCEAVGGG